MREPHRSTGSGSERTSEQVSPLQAEIDRKNEIIASQNDRIAKLKEALTAARERRGILTSSMKKKARPSRA